MKKKNNLILLVLLLLMIVGIPRVNATYKDYKTWANDDSQYQNMRNYSCWIVAQAKLLVELGIEKNDPSTFNPEIYAAWEANNYHLAKNALQGGSLNQINGLEAPSVYASTKGYYVRSFQIDGPSEEDLLKQVNNGNHIIVSVNYNPSHYVYINNEKTIETGKLYIYDSWTDSSGNFVKTLPTANNLYTKWYTAYVYEKPIKYANISGIKYIRNVSNKKYLTVDGYKDTEYANLYVADFISSKQQVTITSVKNNNYKLKPTYTSKLINLYEFPYSVKAGTNVNIASKDDEYQNTQKWAFEKTSKGYIIHSIANPNYVLALNGTNVVVKKISDDNKNNDQYWQLFDDIGNIVTVSGISNKTYTGSAIKQSIIVKKGDKTLVNGTDYKVSYKNNTNAGKATVTITGINNYVGTISKTFTINAKSIEKFTLSGVQTKAYTGKERKLNLELKDGSKKLSEETDYTVSYKKNINPGTATVTITGKGNYKGTISKTYTIKIATVSDLNAKVTGNSKIKLTWKKSIKASGYEIQYRTSSIGSYKTLKKDVSSNLEYYNITKLSTKKGKKYYIRVRAYQTINGKKYYSDYKTVTLKIK